LSGSRTVLITGGSGIVGSRLVELLGQRGWRVRALIHRRPVPGAAEQVDGDLGEAASLRGAAEGATAVVHVAGVTHARRDAVYESANVAGTANMLRATRAAAAGRFLHVSTRAISLQGGAYSRSKHLAEELVREEAPDHVIVRLPELYGGGGVEGVDEIIARARRGARIPLVGRGSDLLCPVHVDDAISALAAALESPAAAGRTYTLAGECMSSRELAERCLRALGSSSRLITVPHSAVAAASLLARVVPVGLYPDQLARLRAPKAKASPEAERELDFHPRSLEDGLAQIAKPEDPR
jgi:nucleoside-diphosphate-sugar epimerase